MSDDEKLTKCEQEFCSAENLFKEQEYDSYEYHTSEEYLAELRERHSEAWLWGI